MRRCTVGYLLLLLIVAASSGASCRPLMRSREVLPPAVFAGPPTLEEIIFLVNTNSARVRQLDSQNASVSTAGVPSLRATLALERPRRLRLRAKIFVSPDLDLGSNDYLFWVWSKHDPERCVYYAYHDQFVTQSLPVGPDWLIESLGLVQLDPAGAYEGPTTRSDEQVEIRARFERNGRPYTRILVVHSRQGWVLEQHILDATGQNLATARCSGHRTYAEAGVTLPHRVQVELPTVQLSFQLEVDQYLVNQLTGDPAQLFEMPVYEGYRQVNLAAAAPPRAATPEAAVDEPSQRTAAEPRLSYRPSYRGLQEMRPSAGAGASR